MIDRWSELAESLRSPETLVVNLYGGPGTGKSTTAALVFAYLKQLGRTVELAPEVAKDYVWEERGRTLDNQVYIFGKQYHRIWRLLGKVDVVICDGPLLLELYYGRNVVGGQELIALSKTAWASMNNLDVFIERDLDEHPYVQSGRYQDVNAAQQVDWELKKLLRRNDIPLTVMRMHSELAQDITVLVEERLATAH